VDQADFSWNQPIYPGQVVTFTGWATGTFPITFTWDFGDGGTAEGNPVTHVFEMAMDYLVTMTATNACGQDVIVYTVVVEEPSCDPVHNTGFFWVPELPSVGDVVTFTAWASGTAPIDFFWTFGDGATATGEVVYHTYQVAGYFTVTLEATNACGQETVSQVVVVQPPGCGEAIQKGDTELGSVDWTESSAGGMISYRPYRFPRRRQYDRDALDTASVLAEWLQ
jgi:PKD repeat protein